MIFSGFPATTAVGTLLLKYNLGYIPIDGIANLVSMASPAPAAPFSKIIELINDKHPWIYYTTAAFREKLASKIR
jgi:hypothetical protein